MKGSTKILLSPRLMTSCPTTSRVAAVPERVRQPTTGRMPNGSGPGQAEVAATCAWGAFAVVPGASVAPESVVCQADVALGGDRATAKLVRSTSAGERKGGVQGKSV